MIEVREGHWVHEPDLAAPVHGRHDPHELSELCVDVLAFREHARGGSKVGYSSERSHRAKSKLLSAKVKHAAVRGDVDLREENQKLHRAIDRLLAFVPARAPEISEERLTELAREVARFAQELFGPRCVAVLKPEHDPDTTAAYRLTLTVPAGDSDFDGLAEGAFRLQHHVAEIATDDEFRAVRVLVELG